LNPGRRGGKPATNRLSYGAALFTVTGNANSHGGKRGGPYFILALDILQTHDRSQHSLYGHECLSLEIREENELRVIYNRVLMRIFGSKRQKVTEEMT
jgi:hypothetical protein